MSGTPFNADLIRVCREIVLPLVQADGGELHLVSISDDEIVLHLSGACSGCPGATLTTSQVIEPALRAQAPGHRVVVTAGATVPKGARKLSCGG